MIARTLAVMLLCGVVATGCAKKEEGTVASTDSAATAAPETAAADATTADAAPPAAEGAQSGASACSLVAKEDWQAVLGPDVQVEEVSPEECKASNMNTGEYQIILRADAASEMATKKQMSDLYKTNWQPVPGLAAEAFTINQGLSIYLNKSGRYAEVNASVVMPTAPMEGKAGVRYIAEKVAEKM